MRTTYYPSPKRLEKLSRDEQLNLILDLINAFRVVKTPTDIALLLQDLLTAKETKNLAKRLRIAKLIILEKTHREIAQNLHCSFATISKVRMWLDQGGAGLRNVISKLPPKYELPKNLPPIPIEFQMLKAVMALAQYSLAKKQNKDIKDIEKMMVNLESKRILDKSLQEAFDEYYRTQKSRRA